MSVDDIDRWLDANDSGPLLYLKGCTIFGARQRLLYRSPVVTVEAPKGQFTEVLTGFRGYVETLIDRLIRIDDLAVTDDLHYLIDQGLYNPQLGDLFEDLWMARFEHSEQRTLDTVLQRLLARTFDGGAVSSRCDALLFWFALMGQNYTIGPGKMNLIVGTPPDGDMTLFFSLSEVWQAYGSPLRILVLEG